MTKRPRMDEALAMILGAVEPTTAETLPAREGLGRVLAADVAVPRDFPDLPRSAVDGFAIRIENGTEREVIGEVRAGLLPDFAVGSGQAAAIMTGAVVPEGADTVVMVEQCNLDGDRLTVPADVPRGDKINPIGDEAREGDLLAPRGRVIDAACRAALLCAGVAEVSVHRRPRVGVLVSGDEVLTAGEAFRPGMVYDSNRRLLEAVCAALDVEVTATMKVADDVETTRDALRQLCADCDFAVTSGGVSRGRYDHVGEILRAEPYETLLTGTAVKPGKPLHVVRSPQDALVVGMPGYPSSFLTNVFVYLVPALKKAAGRTCFETGWLRATTESPLRYRPGKQYLNRVEMRLGDGRWFVRDPGSQMSSHFLNFARVGGIVRMPLDAPAGHEGGAALLPAGSEIEVMHLGLEVS